MLVETTTEEVAHLGDGWSARTFPKKDGSSYKKYYHISGAECRSLKQLLRIKAEFNTAPSAVFPSVAESLSQPSASTSTDGPAFMHEIVPVKDRKPARPLNRASQKKPARERMYLSD